MSFFLMEDGRLMLQYPRLSPRERKGFREIDRTFYHQTNCAFFTRFLSHTHPSCRLSILFLQFSKRKKKKTISYPIYVEVSLMRNATHHMHRHDGTIRRHNPSVTASRSGCRGHLRFHIAPGLSSSLLSLSASQSFEVDMK